MNKLIAVGIIIVLSVNVTVMVVGFSYLHNEINQLKNEESDLPATPTPTEPEPIPEPEPEPTPEPSITESATSSDRTAEYTFLVYRWWNGAVTRSMLDKVYAGRTAVLAPLLFTYRLNDTYGMAAYYPNFGQGFTMSTSDFENALTKFSEEWTKTYETATIPYKIYQTTDHPEYAHLFP